MSEGRRPDGPGWYWYEGKPVMVDERVTMHDTQELAVYWVDTDESGCEVGWHFVSAMPGDFVPLTKPVAAPEPDWTQAPEWAMWWAEDGDGVQRWFEHEPKPSQYNEWESPWSRNSVIQRTPHWRTTLRKRPEVGGE